MENVGIKVRSIPRARVEGLATVSGACTHWPQGRVKRKTKISRFKSYAHTPFQIQLGRVNSKNVRMKMVDSSVRVRSVFDLTQFVPCA